MDARDEILNLLDEGPVAALELAADLGYDPVQIGLDESGNGYWSHGEHGPALTDLVKEGRVRMRVCDDLSIEYGLAEHLREDESGERSPIIVQVRQLFDAIFASVPDVDRPFWNVAQRSGTSLAYNGRCLDLSYWDYVVDSDVTGSGIAHPLLTWAWPADGLENDIRQAFVAAAEIRETVNRNRDRLGAIQE